MTQREITFDDGDRMTIESLPNRNRLTMAEAEALIGRQIVSGNHFYGYDVGTVTDVLDWPITGGARAFVLDDHPTICLLASVVGVVVE